MSQAYLQLSLDNESREYVTVTFRSFVCSFHFSENHGKLLQGNEEALKVRAIQKAPKPRNVNELRSFFGIINYYSCFLPNLSTKLSPLYHSLQKDARWIWGKKQTEAFEAAKHALQDNPLLVHYDEAKPLLLACDASQCGLGAVLSHIMEYGKERPVAIAIP